jgi:hypothetical protein
MTDAGQNKEPVHLPDTEERGLWYMAFVAERTESQEESTYVIAYMPKEYVGTSEAVLEI